MARASGGCKYALTKLGLGMEKIQIILCVKKCENNLQKLWRNLVTIVHECQNLGIGDKFDGYIIVYAILN